MTYNAARAFRMSPQQRQTWQVDQARGLGVRGVIAIDGRLSDADAEQALHRVIAQHEILRTTFHREAGMTAPVQVINDDAPAVTRIDLSGRSAEAQAIECARLAPLREVTPDNPATWVFVRLGPRRLALVVRFSALVGDGATLDLLAAALAGALAGLAPGETLQFADLAEWEHEQQSSPDAEEGRAFWRAIAERPAPRHEDVPFARPGRAPAVPRTARTPLALDGLTGGRLRQLAATHDVSIPALLDACWRALICRLTGRVETVVGVLADGRDAEALSGTLGPLERWLPVAVAAAPGHSLIDLTREVAVRTREALAWQDAYIGGSQPLATAFTAAQERRPSSIDVRESGSGEPVRVTCVERDVVLAPLVVAVQWSVLDDRIDGALDYDVSRLAGAAAHRLAAQYSMIVSAACASPLEPIARVRFVGEEEHAWQRSLMHEPPPADAAPVDAAADALVCDRIAAHAAAHPETTALVGPDGTWTYKALDEETNRLARYLRGEGVGRETRVGLAFRRGASTVAALLGVLKAGGAFVPLDIAQPAPRLQRVLADAQLGLLVCETPEVADHLAGHTGARVITWSQACTRASAQSAATLTADVMPDQLAYVLFTSGSTGRPKGVSVEHRQLAHYVRAVAARAGFEPGWHYATVSSLAADLGYTMVFGALCSGGTLHVIDPDAASDAAALGQYVSANRIDCLKIVPSHLHALLSGSAAEAIVPSRLLMLGGEASSWTLVHRILAHKPQCVVVNHYGPTETTIGAIALVLTPPADSEGPVPLGHPLGGVEAWVLDERGDLAPAGALGELAIGGPTVSRGYFGQPAQTAARFVPDPLGGRPGARLYRTGDLARLQWDGRIEFHGRIDQQVKLHGHRIEPGEIEAVLSALPDVREAAVVLREDSPGQPRLVAYVAAANGTRLASDALRAHVSSRLPDAFVPAAFVSLPALPRLGNGKIDRASLPAPAPAPDRTIGRFHAPQGPLEAALVEIWRELLDVAQLSTDDDFFERGGHSLLAIQVVSRVSDTLHMGVPVRTLFDAPTVQSFAQALVRLEPAPGHADTAARLHLKTSGRSRDEVASMRVAAHLGGQA